MPSRKKAQGRARKAEKAKQAAETKRCTCMHSEARASWTEDEEKWAVEVGKEFVSKFTATLETKEGCVYTKELTLMASAIYTKYCQSFCERKICTVTTDSYRGITYLDAKECRQTNVNRLYDDWKLIL
jgi:hypothetical protein